MSLAISFGAAIAVQGARGDMVSGSSGSLLAPLASGADFEARPVTEEHWTDGSQPRVSVKALARQSVPDRDRASHYRVHEVFTHSKIAMPLLVVDLEPQSLLFVRPMSGRSVGAAPSARWTKAVSIVEVAPESVR